jgi:hypothetical protein
MPWKTNSVMEERLRFGARILDGEAMTDVCRVSYLSEAECVRLVNACEPVAYARGLHPP